jgi:hypothetical protein
MAGKYGVVVRSYGELMKEWEVAVHHDGTVYFIPREYIAYIVNPVGG